MLWLILGGVVAVVGVLIWRIVAICVAIVNAAMRSY